MTPSQFSHRSRFYRRFSLAALGYVGMVAGGALLLNQLDPAPAWLGVAVGAAAVVPAAFMLGLGPWLMRSQEGLERWVLYRAASVAFFVTMAVLLAGGLLEGFAQRPALGGWWSYSVGMLTWGGATIALRRSATR